MTTNAVHPPIAASPRQIIGAVAASCFGWALDLFDLFILLYVAPVIGRLFFPSSHPMLSLAAVYASFAVTLLLRPLGSAIFGAYADKRGRRRSMIFSIIGVGVATAAFGLLPTLAQAGALAPVLFLALRLVQGIFVGGLVASTHTIGTESVPNKYRGAVSGLIGGGGAGIGAILASVIFLIMSKLFPGESFDVWGWRCMFFTGLLSSAVGLWIFNGLEESPLWQELAARKKAAAAAARAQGGEIHTRSPVKALFSKDYRHILLVNLLLTIGGGSGYYLTSGFLPTFLKIVNKLPNDLVADLMLWGSFTVLVSCVLVGHLSSYIGRKKTFLIVGVIQLVARPLLYLWLPDATGTGTIFLYVMTLSILGSIGYAPILIFLNERFPTAIRATGTGLSWNIGFAIGGMMPTFVSLTAGAASDLPVVLSWFITAITVIFLFGAAIVPETRGALDRQDENEPITTA